MYDDADEARRRFQARESAHVLRRHEEAVAAAGRDLDAEETARVVADAIAEFWRLHGHNVTVEWHDEEGGER